TIADSSQVIAKFENLFLFLAETEEALGHFPEATTYYRLWGIQKDSTYARASSEALAELQVRYDLARHEKENLELKTIRQEQERQNAIQNVWIIGLSSGLLILALVFAGVSMRRRYRQRVAKEEETRRLQHERFRSWIEGESQ